MKLKEEEPKFSRARFGISVGLILLGFLMDNGGSEGAGTFFLIIGASSIAMKYLFVGRESSIKVIFIPTLAFIILGFLFLTAGFIMDANFLFIGAISVVFNKVALPVIDGFQNKFLPWLETKYQSLLKYALFKRRPGWFFVGMFGLLIFSFVILGAFTPKVLFFPENQPNYVNVFVQHPIGTDINETNKTTLEVERIISEEILADEIADTVGLRNG
jgi:multidrug efflux pump subunit AcrB